MTRTLIVGAGFAGLVAAQMLTAKGHDVTVIERAPELGGTCRTYWHGDLPYTIGPRHFLTTREDVFEFLNKSCPMRRYPNGHRFLTYVEQDSSFWHFPIHNDDIDQMPDAQQIRAELRELANSERGTPQNLEEFWLGAVGRTLYAKFIDGYSRKQWGIPSNTEITDFAFSPKGTPIKTGPKAAWTDRISGFPLAPDGYNGYFPLAVKDATVYLSTDIKRFDLDRNRVYVEGPFGDSSIEYDLLVSTISPEIVMNNAYGPLRWAGRDFFKLVLPTEHIPGGCVFPPDVYFTYYAGNEPFTRVVDYKLFYRNVSPNTLLGIEIPSKKNKLYPFPMAADQARHKQYTDAAPDNVFWIGRNGSYRYLDVGLIIEQCFRVFADV